MKNKRKSKEDIRLMDRVAVAFLSGILALFSGFIIWFLLVASFNFEGKYIFSSFKWVIGFAGIMAIAGFFMLENWIANLFGRVWHFIYNYLRH